MGNPKKSTALSVLLNQITSEAIRESIDIYLSESETDERVKMAKSLDRRYVNEEDDEEAAKEKSGDVTGISPEKIAPGGDAESDANAADTDKRDETPPDVPVPTDEELMSPSFEMIRDQLNLVRSGSSLRNPDVDKQFRSYIESLSEESTRQLLLFITGLAQIIAGRIPASEAVKPTGNEANSQPKPVDTDGSGDEADVDDPVELSVSDNGGKSMPIVVGEHVAVRNLIERAKKRS